MNAGWTPEKIPASCFVGEGASPPLWPRITLSQSCLCVPLSSLIGQDSRLAFDKLALYFPSRAAVICDLLEHPGDPGHSGRVGEITAHLVTELGFTHCAARWGRAAELHDLGKMFFTADLLAKPGPLNSLESRCLRIHPWLGYALLVVHDPLAAVGALTHHERWDGAGYPQGLRGEAINLFGRVLAVADAFDAMTSKRSYQVTLTPAQALRELERGSGGQFDPGVVQAAVRSLKTPR